MKTRKNKRGGGMFDIFSSKPTTPSQTVSTLEAQRNANLRKSKSRVANVLAKPGEFKYTNKEAIRAKYDQAIEELKKLEKPQESVSALKQLSESLDKAMKSQTARETGAVIITMPVGVAQLVVKALRLFLAALVLIFSNIISGLMSGSFDVDLAAGVAPNAGFNTTKQLYNKARKLTGAMGTQVSNVQNFR